MSEYSWDDTDEPADESNLVKQLRKQLDAAGKAVKERDKTIAEQTTRLRAADLADTLSGIGANPKLAGFVPAEVETTKEAVSAWFDAHKDVFGAPAPQEPSDDAAEHPATQGATSLDPEVAAAMQRVQAQEAAPGSQPHLGSEEAFIEQMKAIAKDSKGSQDFFARLGQAGSHPSS